MNSQERWVEIEEFPNYLVSDFGRVMNRKTGRILKQDVGRKGYFRVKLCGSDGCHTKDVHRLVAPAFIGELPIGLETNHIDGVKTNNKVDNFEFITHSENINHAIKMGLKKPSPTAGRKPKPVTNFDTGERFSSVSDAARTIGVSPQHLSSYLKRGSSLKGSRFEYTD